MKILSIRLVLVAFVLTGSSVAADVITFDGLSNDIVSDSFTSGTEGAYTITNGGVDNLSSASVPGGGDLSLGHKDSGNAIIRLDRGGAQFMFSSLSLRERFSTSNPDVTVTGYTSDFGVGLVGSETYDVTGGFVTHFATAGGLLHDWVGYLEIDLGAAVGGQTLINNVQVVPEPSSFAFLALIATGGMTVRRRRKRT
ncbi:MAG: PEP-CTERM sorting domain-containing protein [Fuerstiella sp.]|nr:PEP-CTERM sorting domain-containing protein [Fuerstiella sp.]